MDDQVAVTPEGSPLAVPIPVAPVVVCIIFVNTVLTHKVGVEDAAVTVLDGLTAIVLLTVVKQPLLSVTVTM